MNRISFTSLAILGGVVLIGGGLYATREWWSPWAEVAPSTSVLTDPAARMTGTAAQDVQAHAAPAPTAANALVIRSRYELQGVMGGAGADASGLALIAVDGGPARTVHVGEAVGDGLVLLGLGAGNARLGLAGGPPVLVLEVGVPSAATGLPQVAGQNTPAGSIGGPMAGSPGASEAYGANGAPLPGSVMTQALPVMTQALPVVAPNRAAAARRPPPDLAHPGRHQRLQGVKTEP